ncbi:acyltransferase [Roseobacter sp. HKCCD5988]|uniref:acyltransferase n=1 Tax=Roseobacter sp. HKCCD5988 TaxID=3120338 RepID=UPI0030EB405C
MGLSFVFRFTRIRFQLANALKRVRFFCVFGKKGWLESDVTLNIQGRMMVGKNCKIGRGTKINVAKDAFFFLADNVFIGANCQIEVSQSVEVERDVTVSDNVFLADVTHRFPCVGLSGERDLVNLSSITIAEGCWLGRNVVVNPGCSISSFNIIAANSVVTKCIVGSWGLHGGAPARLLKQLEMKN